MRPRRGGRGRGATEQKFVCPVDSRCFSTRAALTQHKRAVHSARTNGQGQKAPRAMRVMAYRNQGSARGGNNRGRVISGKDIVSVFDIDSKAVSGTMLAQINLNPHSFSGTRLDQEAALWTRWRPQMMVVTVASSAGFMITGSYMIGWTGDSAESFVGGPGVIPRVGALVPSVTSFVGANSTLSVPCDTVQKWLYTNSQESDDSTHGKIVICLNGALGTITQGKITLTVTLTWRCAFEYPRLTGAQVSQTIYADSDYAGYHTTSTNDWAGGTKLSLKQHAGGSLVPFPKARPQTVYMLDPQANLGYYSSASGKGRIIYGVLIPNFSVKAFAVFSDKEKATKFAQSGDSSHCLTYYAAGPVVDPDNPSWTEVMGLHAVQQLDAEKEQLKAQIAELQAQLQVALDFGEASSSTSFLGVEASENTYQ